MGRTIASVTERIEGYRSRIRAELRKSFAEEHPPGQVAGSFALGAFITMLPTLGVGLLLFVVLAYYIDRISKIALFASVVVFNPVVKWGVYASSFTLGVVLLGPVEGATPTTVSLSAGPEIVTRLLVGNVILAVIATVLSYVAVYRLTIAYRKSELGDVVSDAVEEVAEEALDR